MTRWFATTLAVVLLSAALRADVTIVQNTTVEGGMAAMAAAAGGGANMNPKLTTRIKGLKSRLEMEGPISVVTIVDLTTKQVIVLNVAQKAATIMTANAPAAATTTATTTTAAPVTLGKAEASVKPTGKSQVIDGVKTEEIAFTTSLDMAQMGGAQLPPEAAAMMQGMKMVMDGSMWVARDAPGAREYVAFQKAAAAGDMAGAAMGGAGVSVPGMENLTKAMASVDGVTMLSEMTMTVEGSGPIADMMRQAGPMKITSKVASITADPLSDDLFKVPEGYTITKR
jgi:hypothetical protein